MVRGVELVQALDEVGVRAFGLERDDDDPHTVQVFLDHRDGLWGTGRAEALARDVPGVVAAYESPNLPSVLVVRLAIEISAL